jgi:hypothetical protein
MACCGGRAHDVAQSPTSVGDSLCELVVRIIRAESLVTTARPPSSSSSLAAAFVTIVRLRGASAAVVTKPCQPRPPHLACVTLVSCCVIILRNRNQRCNSPWCITRRCWCAVIRSLNPERL